MGAIRGSGPAAERLRAFVRERVHKDGAHYQRGAGALLARHLKKGQPWVSNYIDREPSSNADVDTALAICGFFKVQLHDFAKKHTTDIETPGSPPPRLTRHEARALRLLQRMNEKGQRLAVQSIAALADAFPRPASLEQIRRPVDGGAATTNRTRGSR